MIELNKINGVIPRLTMGLHDLVTANGDLLHDQPIPCVMVRSQADLTALPTYLPGTIAYTAGFKNLWQLDVTGTWVNLKED